jgi:acyl-CoA thioester hydrolase
MHNEIFESLHKVRTFECDFYGHVNNAIYLNYLEFARMEVKKNGFMIVIRKVEIRFKFPAMAGDQLVIRTTLKECLRTNGTFHQKILRAPDEKSIAEADVNWVVVNLAGKPVRIPLAITGAFGLNFST